MVRVPKASVDRAVFFSVLRFLLLFALLFSLAACGKKLLTPTEIRAITREFVFAARKVTAGKAEIGMWPESLPAQAAGRVNRGPGEAAADHIYITLPPGRSGRSDPVTLGALERELNRVAERHDLVREDRQGLPGLVRFAFRRGDQRTHSIHIITPLVHRVAGAPAPGARANAPRLAIIIDDVGYDRAAADALFALPFPLALSVLPNVAHSTDIAEEAYRRGYQVMLHLPMESSNGESKPEAVQLRSGMSPGEAARLLGRMLETVPHAVGVNNHQGSLATADPGLMAAIMTALRERELFFLDSRTTAATVAHEAAVREGVPAASRNVFLDDVATREAVRQQLALAARHARQQGFAIAIGHPHPATLEALQEYLPQLEAQGIRLVFPSELVR